MSNGNPSRRRSASATLRGGLELPMSRRVAPVALGVICSVSFASTALAADGARGQAVVDATKALWQTPQKSFAAKGDEFTVKDVILDEDGSAHVRYNRAHHDIPVIGGDLVVHLKPGGALDFITAAQKAPITDDATPGRTSASARASAQSRFGGAGRRAGAASLVYDATKGAPRLAHEVVVSSTSKNGVPSEEHVLTDADTGQPIRSWDGVKHVDGIGRTQYSGTRTLQTTAVTGGYTLVSNYYSPAKVCAYTVSACLDLVDADNDWGDGTTSDPNTKAADVSFGLNSTFEFFDSWFGRAGVYSDGTPLTAVVGFPGEIAANIGKVEGEPDVNLIFGDGTGGRPFTSVDIVAHEVAHSLTEDTANLDYWGGESGGLNEATSDIIGTLTEFFTASSTRPPNYKLGEDLTATGTPKRYMYEPSLDGASPNCWSSTVGSLDQHQSSGLANKFFFMLAEGSSGSTYGTAPTCGAPAVAGISRYSAAKIWYRALTTYMTSTTAYKAVGSNDARAATLSAAADLYGSCSTKYRSVQAAWNATGVSGEDPNCPPIINTLSAAAGSTTTATVSSTVGIGTATSATVQLKYGTTTAYGTTQTKTLSSSTGDLSFSFALSGLTAATKYHYQLTVTSADGTVTSANQTFFTKGAPTVNALSAVSNTTTTATVESTIGTYAAPFGSVSLQYGPTTSYGTTKNKTLTTVDGGISFSYALTGLTPGTTYHYRVSVTTADGTVTSADKTFVTKAPPTITTLGTTGVGATTATVDSTIATYAAPFGSVSLKYGTTTAYGTIKNKTLTASGGGISFTYPLTGLTPNTTYHYQVSVTTADGTVTSADKTFTTTP